MWPGAEWGNEGWEGEGGGAQRGPEKGHWGLWRGTAGEHPFIPSFHGLRGAGLGVGGIEEVDMERRWEAEGT